jgi:hypothetical protein
MLSSKSLPLPDCLTYHSRPLSASSPLLLFCAKGILNQYDLSAL